jgi:hypothetical protein
VVGVGGEGVDVVLDGVVGQLVRPGRGVELRAEEDVFPSGDELFVDLGSWLKARCQRRALSFGGRNSGGEGDMPGRGASETTKRSTRSGWSAARA